MRNMKPNLKKVLASCMVAVMSFAVITNSGALSTLNGNPTNMVAAVETGVDLGIPSNVVVTPQDPFCVVITWDKVEGANIYWVFYTDSNGVTTKQLSGTNKAKIVQLVPGATYTYQVQAVYKKQQDETTSELSEVVSFTNAPIGTPQITSTEFIYRDDGTYDICVYYTPMDYMRRMYLYGSSDGVTYTKWAQNGARGNHLYHSGLEPGETYYIKACAYQEHNGVE